MRMRARADDDFTLRAHDDAAAGCCAATLLRHRIIITMMAPRCALAPCAVAAIELWNFIKPAPAPRADAIIIIIIINCRCRRRRAAAAPARHVAVIARDIDDAAAPARRRAVYF